MENIGAKIEGYYCGWEDATGDCPSKKQLIKYLMNTCNFTKEESLNIIEEHCEGWYDGISSEEED